MASRSPEKLGIDGSTTKLPAAVAPAGKVPPGSRPDPSGATSVRRNMRQPPPEGPIRLVVLTLAGTPGRARDRAGAITRRGRDAFTTSRTGHDGTSARGRRT